MAKIMFCYRTVSRRKRLKGAYSGCRAWKKDVLVGAGWEIAREAKVKANDSIGNPTDKQVTIADFRVLWPLVSFKGQELRLIRRSKPDRINVFGDLDTLIKAHEQKSDQNATKFPVTIPPHTSRFLIVHLVFDLLSGERGPLEFPDENKAYKLLSSALGWKPESDGDFHCLNKDITVEIITPDREQLKFASLTGLIVPGCFMYLSPKPAQPTAVSNSVTPNFSNSTVSSLDSTFRSQSHVSKVLDVDAYTKIILREPGNADAFNERGKAYRAIGDFDHAIQDFTEAIRLRPFFPEAKKNLEEAKQAKAKSACGFQIVCK